MADTPIPTPPASQDDLKQALVEDIRGALSLQETSVLKRNNHINHIYDVVYRDGLLQGLPVKKKFDNTRYNFLKRVVEIMSGQLMGRGFRITSTYDKQDLKPYSLPAPNPQAQQQQDAQKQQIEVQNARLQADANLREEMVRSIIKDNGGMSLWNRAAKMGSYSGITIFKHWKDSKAKRYNINLLENPNNFWRKWADSDFRSWDWSCYAYQISESQAYKQYGDYLPEGEVFEYAVPGGNIWNKARAEDINDLPVKMVWVIDITGSIDGWKARGNGDKATLQRVKRGKEEDFNALIVGGRICSISTTDLPNYTVINNLEEPLNPWGVSDITEEAIDINRTIMQVAQYWVTLGIKSLFYKLKFKGFSALNMPANLDMEVQGIPMDPDQDIQEVNTPQNFQEFSRIIEWLIEAFVRVTRIGRIMFDDPRALSDSNQSMLTSMKGLIDTIEDKQTRWAPAMVEMFETALRETAPFDKALAEAVNSGDNWQLRVQWAPWLRREDPAFQAMWHNNFNSGLVSPETMMAAVGIENPSEEMDRMRDTLEDPTAAAMVSKQLGEIAGFTIRKSVGMPPWGYIIPKVQLRGDLAPEETGNMAHNFGWDQGPYGPGIGPTGNRGLTADDAWLNDVSQQAPPDTAASNGAQPAQQVQPDQNTPQPVSQAGSGATPTSPQGAVNKTNQQQRQ